MSRVGVVLVRRLVVPSSRRVPTILGGPRRIVFVIGCGRLKASMRMPARELYRGALFRKSLELAELLADQAFIVSAKHGLLELGTLVDPYEEDLRDATKAHRDAWGRDVGNALEARLLGGVARPHVVLLAGEIYTSPIMASLARRPRFLPPLDLLVGLQIGERLSFLNRAIALAKGGR